jgi:hypothetical protein
LILDSSSARCLNKLKLEAMSSLELGSLTALLESMFGWVYRKGVACMPLRFVKERKKKSHLRVVGVAAVEGKEAGLSLICSCSHKSKQKSHHSLRSFMYDVSNRKNSTTKYTSFFVRTSSCHPSVVLFVSEQTSHQQPASIIFLSEQTSTGHQPPSKRTEVVQSYTCLT